MVTARGNARNRKAPQRAAGALVSPGTRIPRRTLMMGSPAKPRRSLTDTDLELIHRPTNNYVELMELYRDGR